MEAPILWESHVYRIMKCVLLITYKPNQLGISTTTKTPT
jgi:hypothetical protein